MSCPNARLLQGTNETNLVFCDGTRTDNETKAFLMNTLVGEGVPVLKGQVNNWPFQLNISFLGMLFLILFALALKRRY